MNIPSLTIPSGELKKLLGAASGDAALLYLYLRAGGEAGQAAQALRLDHDRYSLAEALLRQLDLWPEERPAPLDPGEKPRYTEQDVLSAMDTDPSFRSLYGEVQRVLGRSLNTEELKILLGFLRYLSLPGEVISVLVCYCKDRARRRGSLRNPSLRTIEKEAYAWAEAGIDPVEAAADVDVIGGLSPGPECEGEPPGPAHRPPPDPGPFSDGGGGALRPELAGHGL